MRLHHLRRVAGVLLLEQLINRARVFQRRIEGNISRKRVGRRGSALGFVIPTGPVVRLRRFVETGIKAVFRQLESLLHQKRRVGEIHQVFFRDALILYGVTDHAAQERNIGASADLEMHVGRRRGTGIPRIDDDHFGVSLAFCLNRPFETARVVFGRIAAHDQHHVGVLDVHPAIRHGPSSKRWPQTGDRGAVSNPGLIFDEGHPEATHGLYNQVVELVGVRAATDKGDVLEAIDRAALRVGGDERFVARALNVASNLFKRLIPRDGLPCDRSRGGGLQA